MKLFFWKRRPEVTGQGFRTQLAAVTGELRMQVAELPDGQVRAELLSELSELEFVYQSNLQQLKQLNAR